MLVGWERRLGASRKQPGRSGSSSVSSISAAMDEDSGEAPATQDRRWPCCRPGWVISVGVSDHRCLDWPSCEATRLRVESDSFLPWASIIISAPMGGHWTLDTVCTPEPNWLQLLKCGSLHLRQSRPSAWSLSLSLCLSLRIQESGCIPKSRQRQRPRQL